MFITPEYTAVEQFHLRSVRGNVETRWVDDIWWSDAEKKGLQYLSVYYSYDIPRVFSVEL